MPGLLSQWRLPLTIWWALGLLLHLRIGAPQSPAHIAFLVGVLPAKESRRCQERRPSCRAGCTGEEGALAKKPSCLYLLAL